MNKVLLALVLSLNPALGVAGVKIGDMIGTNGDCAKVALEKAGCPLQKFEAEGGKVGAVCKMTISGDKLETALDPTNGAVANIKKGD